MTREALRKALLTRPIDHEIYRKARVTGLTRLLYGVPWSVLWLTMGVLLVAILWTKR